jgi:glucose/arabinose dehydrogenase
VAFHDGHLYVAEQHRIVRYPAQGLAPGRPLDAEAEVIFDRLPDKVHHGWRYIGFGPDGKLYVTVGVACNICDAEEPEGTILSMDPDGANVETFAHGIGNSVGFDFHPNTGVLRFTDNGTDDMGDNEPPCEFNAAPEAGMHFGFPYYAGGHARHPDWADRQPPQEVTFPVFAFQAHTAPLRVAFYTGEQFPEEYRGDAFVAQHGSWNRSIPIGYRIKRILFDDAGAFAGHEVFIDGWLDGALAWGRPVDVLEVPDGMLLISDDHQDVLYRVRYTGERAQTEAERDQAQAGRDQAQLDLATAGRFKAGTCTTCHGPTASPSSP